MSKAIKVCLVAIAGWIALWAVLASLAHSAEPNHEVTITNYGPTGKPCTVSFDGDNLMLSNAWVRVVTGQMDPDLYMRLYKKTFPGDADAATSAQHIVDECTGAGL